MFWQCCYRDVPNYGDYYSRPPILMNNISRPPRPAWDRCVSRAPTSISASAVEMAESILRDRKKVLPCAAYLEGEYGIKGLYVGVPCRIGAGGVEKIYEIKLSAEESAALKKSAAAVQELVDVIKKKMAE